LQFNNVTCYQKQPFLFNSHSTAKMIHSAPNQPQRAAFRKLTCACGKSRHNPIQPGKPVDGSGDFMAGSCCGAKAEY
jgi:hypothetical protein